MNENIESLLLGMEMHGASKIIFVPFPDTKWLM